MKEECIIVLQPLDERGEPKGEPLKIRGPAVLTPGTDVVPVKERHSGNVYHVHKLVVVTAEKTEALPGYYGLVTPLLIRPQDDGALLLYGSRHVNYPIFIRIGKQEVEEALHIMESGEEIRIGKEGADVFFPYAYREVGKEDNMPVIGRDTIARIRIYIETLKEEAKNLYQPR